MNTWVFIAGALSGITLLAHLIGGGKEFHQPFLKSQLNDTQKAIFSIIWHMISVILLANFVGLCWSAIAGGPSEVVMLIAVQNLAFAALFFGYGIARLGSIFQLPQWIAFTLISAFAGAGILKEVLL